MLKVYEYVHEGQKEREGQERKGFGEAAIRGVGVGRVEVTYSVEGYLQ